MWSKEKPTKEGWYWVKDAEDPEPDIIHFQDERSIYICGDDRVYRLDFFDDAIWQPVQPPKGTP